MKKAIFVLMLLVFVSFAYALDNPEIAHFYLNGTTDALGNFSLIESGSLTNPIGEALTGTEDNTYTNITTSAVYRQDPTGVDFDDYNTGLSFNVWMRRTGNITGADGRLFSVDSTAPNGQIMLRLAQSGGIRYRWGSSDACCNYDIFPNNPILDGEWHMLTITHNTTQDTFWIDGILQHNATSGTLADNKGNLAIADSFSTGQPYKGDLDELSIFSRALTPTEINELLTNPYPFEELNITPPTPEENVTIFLPLNNSNITSDPLDINFSLNIDTTSICNLYTNLTGDFTIIDTLTNGTGFIDTSSNPIAYYDFEESNGSIVIDQSGNSHDGANSGASYVSSLGHSGTGSYALDFDGVSDGINIPDADNLTFDGAFSVCSWINMDSTNPFRIAGKRTGVSPTEWFFTIDGSHFPRVQIYDETSGGFIGRTGSSVVTYQDEWVHICFTYSDSGISNGIKIYLNATQIDNLDTESGSFTTVRNTDAFLELATLNNATAFGDGTYDEFAFFTYELSQENVTDIFNNGVTVLTQPSEIIAVGNYSLEHDLPPNTVTDIEYYVNCSGQVSQTILIHYFNDFTPPEITVLAPSFNGTLSTNVDINFTTDETATCSLNNTIWQNTFDNGTFFSFNDTGASEGTYHLNITCFDSVPNTAYKFWLFRKDFAFPSINWVFPNTLNTSTTISNVTRNLDITVSDSTAIEFYECLVKKPSGSLLYNFTMDNLNSSSYNINDSMANLQELGIWTVDCRVQDDAMNEIREIKEFQVLDTPFNIQEVFNNMECPNESIQSVMLFAFMFMILVVLYIFAEVIIKYPIVNMVVDLGFMLYGFIFIGCHTLIGTFLIAVAIIMFVVDAVRKN